MSKIHILGFSLLLIIYSVPLSAQCYELLWAEEFDTTGMPDSETWNFETGGGGWGNNELQYYRADSSNAYVENGTLVITARKENYGGKDYTSARITTQDKFEFQYGKIEARMRLPFGQGIWPAFWMLGANHSEVGWPACGEIDIMEMVGGQDRENTVHGTVFWDHNGSNADYGQPYTLPSGIFADAFHLFSVEWTPQSIRWFVDGIQFNVIDITSAPLSEFHNKFFVILNLAVGGNWPGSPDATTQFPQQMEVDYVRMYKGIESFTIEGQDIVGQRSTGLSYALPFSDSIQYLWSVPEDAEISEGQGTSEITVNWGCADGEVACEVTGTCDTYLASMSIQVENQIQGPQFVDKDGEYTLSITPMSETTYLWDVPSDAEILEGQGTASVTVRYGSLFTDVTLTTSNSCGTGTFLHNVLETGQYPYPDPLVPHSLPGSINATEYDFGGEGLAYHDMTLTNEGDGIRQDERVDTQNSDAGTPNVGWIEDGEWMEYSVRVDSTWAYKVDLRVATDNASGGPFSILVNGEERLGSIQVPGTGGWDKFTTLRPGTIALYETDTVMRVNFVKGGFNLGRMTFTPASSTSAGPSLAEQSFSLYPNPAGEILKIDFSIPGYSFRIIDLTGSMMMEGLSPGQLKTLDISKLQAGTYLVMIQSSNGITGTEKFIKLP